MSTFYKWHHATDDTKEFYIGSSINLEKRMKEHKRDCNNPHNIIKVYAYVRNNGGSDAWTFTKIGYIDTQSNKQKLIMEGKLIKEHGSTLNTNRACVAVQGKKAKAIVDIECNRCGCTFQGVNTDSTKDRHQRTIKCMQLTRDKRSWQSSSSF